jgi:hypothetical protein
MAKDCSVPHSSKIASEGSHHVGKADKLFLNFRGIGLKVVIKLKQLVIGPDQ